MRSSYWTGTDENICNIMKTNYSPAHKFLVLTTLSSDEGWVWKQTKLQTTSALDMTALGFIGGFCTFAISTKISHTGPYIDPPEYKVGSSSARQWNAIEMAFAGGPIMSCQWPMPKLQHLMCWLFWLRLKGSIGTYKKKSISLLKFDWLIHFDLIL